MSTIHGTVSKNGYSFYAEVTETVPSDYISTNSTTVNVSVYIQNHGTRTASGGWTFVLKVDGSEKIHLTSQTVKTNDVPANGGTKLLMQTSVPVTHNSDGSKTATIEAYIEKPSYTAYDPGRCSLNGRFELTKIPRYANATFYAGSIQETSLRITWAANATIQDVRYRLNNGSWITAQTDVNNLNGEFMINNLSPNTQYTIDVDVKRKDSGLWSFDAGYSMSRTITTYDYPKITSAPDFTIGNTLRIDFYNPLSRNCSIYIIFADGTEYGGDETTQNYVQGYTSSTWQSKFYSSIPNSRTGKYKVRLICTAVSRDTTVSGGTYTAPEAKPTFSNFSYYDADEQVVTVTGSNQTIVRNKSDVKIKISSDNKMLPKNYANPDRYETSWAGGTKSVPYSSDDINVDLGKITTSGQTNISVTAYDKRGYWTTVSKIITVINYTEPEQSNALYRINGFENDTKLTIKGTFNLLTINNVNKNTITNVKYRYKEQGGTYNDYTTVQATVTDNKYECEMLSFNLDNSKSFVFEIVVTDKLGTYSKEILLSEGIPILFINSTKKNIGIGEINENEEYSLQIKGNYYFKSGNEILDYDIVDKDNNTVKLKNKYWDTSGILHNNVPLNDCIFDYQRVNMSGYKGYWCRIATCIFGSRYARFYGRVMVDNDGYEPSMADIWFSYYSQDEITSDNPFITQTKVITSIGGFSYEHCIAMTIEGKNTTSVRVSLWIYEWYDYSSMKITRMYGNCDIKNYTRAKTLPGDVTYLS